MSQLAFETRLNSDGTENPKYVDVLDEDKPLLWTEIWFV